MSDAAATDLQPSPPTPPEPTRRAPRGPPRPATQGLREPVIEIRGLVTRFGDHVVHDGLDLEVRRAETFAIVGGSGTGKSTLLREMILLHRPQAGRCACSGEDAMLAISTRAQAAAAAPAPGRDVPARQRPVRVDDGARERGHAAARVHAPRRSSLVDEIAAWKIALTGLEAGGGGLKYPSELSGGMHQRAALARALALDPELLFLDEPTAGLDPASADGVAALVRELRDLLGLTVVVITHDLDLLWQAADRVAVLGGGKVRGVGSMRELADMDHPGHPAPSTRRAAARHCCRARRAAATPRRARKTR